MSKKKIKNKPQEISQEEVTVGEFSEKTEKTFKKYLRIMSWTVGVCFVLILFLPFFNDPAIDRLTKYLFNLGLITLIVFSLAELNANSIKKLIEKKLTDN